MSMAIFFTSGQRQACAEKIDNALVFVNGDCRRPVCVHYERDCGRCSTYDDALANFKAACCSVGVLLDSCGVVLPSKARWGTLRDAITQQGPGLLIHQLLPRSTLHATSQWKACDPGEASPDDYRAWHKSKAWRSKCTLGDPIYCARVLGHYWSSTPQHMLWKRLEHLDANGGSLAVQGRVSRI